MKMFEIAIQYDYYFLITALIKIFEKAHFIKIVGSAEVQ